MILRIKKSQYSKIMWKYVTFLLFCWCENFLVIWKRRGGEGGVEWNGSQLNILEKNSFIVVRKWELNVIKYLKYLRVQHKFNSTFFQLFQFSNPKLSNKIKSNKRMKIYWKINFPFFSNRFILSFWGRPWIT